MSMQPYIAYHLTDSHKFFIQALLAKGEMLPSSSIAADYMYSVASILLNNGQLRSLALHNHNFNEQSIVILAKQLEVP